MSVAELLAIGLPTLSVLVGILLNRNDVSRLDGRITSLENRLAGEIASVRSEIGSLRSSVSGEVNSLRADIRELREDIALIRSDQREFYRSLGEHEIRLDNLEKK